MNTEKIKIYTVVLVCYGTFCGLTYLFGYWSTFDVDFFNFISTAQIIQYSIYNITLSLGVACVGAIAPLLGELFSLDNPKPPTELMTAVAGKTLKFALNNISIIIFAIFLAILVLNSQIYYDKWFYICIALYFLIFFITFVLVATNNSKLINKNNLIIFAVLLFIPLGCLNFAKEKALKIYYSDSYQYMTINRDMQDRLGTDETVLKLLGHTNDYTIFSSIDNSTTYIIRMKAINSLQLKTYTRKIYGLAPPCEFNHEISLIYRLINGLKKLINIY
ncbi:hypothetical protein [Solidesulfovibrio sp.]